MKADILKEVPNSLCSQRNETQSRLPLGEGNANNNYFGTMFDSNGSVHLADTSFTSLPNSRAVSSSDNNNNDVLNTTSAALPPFIYPTSVADTKLVYSGNDFTPKSNVSVSSPINHYNLEKPHNDGSNYAAFIFKHGLVTDNTYKHNGNALQYVELICYFENNFMSLINDRNVLFIRLLDMLEGPAKQAVQFCRYERGTGPLIMLCVKN